MMRTKHRVILAAGVVIILGALALLPQQVSEPLLGEGFRSRLSEELGLTASDTLSIAAQSGNFVRVNLHGAEGGGIWVIVHHTATSTEVITTGQDYPTCAPLEAADVPIDLEPACWAADGATLIERIDAQPYAR